jgi:RNA polymerase sigma-70 factor (ECF subfamily)
MYVDKEIITGCLNNNQLAQHKLYKLIYGTMMKVCYRYTNNRDDAVDLLNIGFLKVLNKLSKYDDTYPFDVWVRKLLTNTIIDEFRKNKSYKSKVLFAEDSTLSTVNKDVYVNNDAIEKLSSADVFKMMQNLPDVTREVLNMQVIEGYTHKEISKALDISESASKWHLVKAKSLLKEMIEKKQRLALEIVSRAVVIAFAVVIII